MRKGLFVVGIVFLGVGLGIVASVPYFYYRSNRIGTELLKEANQKFQAQSTAMKKRQALVIPTNVKSNTLLGEVDIPKLSLQAPILEGTQDKEINVAVGHLPTSVLPGENGTSILAAHNATWFRHVNKLKPGNQITVRTSYGTYTFSVTRAKVVHVGTPVKNTRNASVVLEACYPLNALYLTPYRYLVFANLKSKNDNTITPKKMQGQIYQPDLPKGLPPADTELKHNSLPLGKMTYKDAPSSRFEQSNAPLSAANALVSLYLSWQHATAAGNNSYLNKLITTNNNNPFIGFPVNQYHYDSLFDITLDVSGNQLISASAIDTVTLNGRRFRITVQATAQNNHMLVLNSVRITP